MADTFFNTLGNEIKGLFDNPTQTITPIFNGVNDGIKEIGQTLNDGAKDAGQTFTGFVDTLGNKVIDLGGKALNSVGGAVSGLASSLTMPLMIIGGIGLVVLLIKPK